MYQIFNCLSKALMCFFFHNWRDFARIVSSTTSKTLFKFKLDSHHRMFQHQLLPLQSFLFWIFQNVYCHLSNRSSIVFPPKRMMQFSHWCQRSRLAPINFGKLADWSWTAAFCFFWTYLIFFVAPESFPNVKNWTEQ